LLARARMDGVHGNDDRPRVDVSRAIRWRGPAGPERSGDTGRHADLSPAVPAPAADQRS
jgi:hypothetical protein